MSRQGSAVTATGVEFSKRGEVYRVAARKEVVLAAGAVQSPQLLMVSGVGPAEHLRQVYPSPERHLIKWSSRREYIICHKIFGSAIILSPDTFNA